MADIFDPCHKWLGIPPNEQPADHYRLLGLSLFEQDADVIESAADKAMVHVRSFQNGKHAKQSQKLLNTLAAARVCLLDDEKRAEYDNTIRGSLKRQEPGVRSKLAPAAGTSAPKTPAALNAIPIAPEPKAKPRGPLAPSPRSKPRPRPKPAAVLPLVRSTVEMGVEIGEVLPDQSQEHVPVRSASRSRQRPQRSRESHALSMFSMTWRGVPVWLYFSGGAAFVLLLLGQLIYSASSPNKKAGGQQSGPAGASRDLPNSRHNVDRRVMSQAKIFADAAVRGDYRTMVSMMPDEVIAEGGGREKLIESVHEKFKEISFVFRSFELGKVTSIANDKTFWLAVVPTTILAEIDGRKVRSDGFLLGSSSDDAETWRFVDGSHDAIRGIKLYNAGLARKLTFPKGRVTFEEPKPGEASSVLRERFKKEATEDESPVKAPADGAKALGKKPPAAKAKPLSKPRDIAEDTMHEWVSKDGRSIKASLLRSQHDKQKATECMLKREDGKVFTVPFSWLSPQSVELAKRIRRKRMQMADSVPAENKTGGKLISERQKKMEVIEQRRVQLKKEGDRIALRATARARFAATKLRRIEESGSRRKLSIEAKEKITAELAKIKKAREAFDKKLASQLKELEQQRFALMVDDPQPGDPLLVRHKGQLVTRKQLDQIKAKEAAKVAEEAAKVAARKREEAAKVAARKRKEAAILANTFDTAQDAANSYLRGLIRTGSVNEAWFLDVRHNGLCFSARYKVNYTSRAGFVLNRIGSVYVNRTETGRWFVTGLQKVQGGIMWEGN